MTEHEKMLITKYDLLFSKHIDENFEEIKSGLRWILGIMLGSYSILLTLMAKGFHWL